jgi:hypothetical protein
MVSDHLALMVQIGARPPRPRRPMKIRRFEEKWVTKADCETIIRESWNKLVQYGSPMFMLCQKITQCRMALVDWSHAAFGHVSNQTSALI